jgi:GH3 auxin-responsive promoter
MNLRATAANLAWIGASLPAWRRYRAALHNPLTAQASLLIGYLERNRETAIGCELDFAGMLSASRRSVEPARQLLDVYRARVPPRGYDQLEPYVQRIHEGEQNVLTSGIVRRLTPSSGSTAARKLLPFTTDLQREFSRAVAAWITDLHIGNPAAARGRAYWSISPAIPHDCAGAVPIGFDDDSEYLGKARWELMRAILAVPDEISRVTDPDAFRYVTLAFLARVRDLRVISVWHPSFLTRLLEPLQRWMPLIADDIGAGKLSPPGHVAPDVLAALQRRVRPEPGRARELRQLSTLTPRDLWPDLTVVSCWRDALAASHADRLEHSIPGVLLQGKGLMATEGVVSIPFGGLHPLAVRSHFFEFVDSAGGAHLAHEIREQQEYTVMLTTGGGLYRYNLGDRVAIDGRCGSTPSIRFLGKEDRISDRFGEKLSDGFVAGVLKRLFEDSPAPRFAMLAPEVVHGGLAYTLFVEGESAPADLATRLECELRRNPHYAWCVDVRQLRPARVIRVGPNADRVYVDACVARGQRLGDVKPAALQCDTNWSAVLVRESVPAHRA